MIEQSRVYQSAGWAVVVAALILSTMPVAFGDAAKPLTEAEIQQIKDTPVTVEQEALIDNLLALMLDGVAPKQERRRAEGAFGVLFGQVFDDDGALERTLAVTTPDSALSEYGMRLTPDTRQVYQLTGRQLFPDLPSCLADYQTMAEQLKQDFPASLVVYDDAVVGEFYMMVADADIELTCEEAEDHPGNYQSEVVYTSEQLKMLNRDEGVTNQINPDAKPLAERQPLRSIFGISWDEPFEPTKRYLDNFFPREITPPQPDPRFSYYEMSRGDFFFQPEMIIAQQNMADKAPCMQIVKDLEQEWHSQYPHAKWLQEGSEERYGIKIIAKDGRLSASCFQPEENNLTTPYRLVMASYQYTSDDEGYAARPFAYDAARIISGESPILSSEAGHHASYTRVQQLVEQYRQSQAEN